MNAWSRLVVAAAGAIGLVHLVQAAERPASTALADYVARADANFGWKERSAGFVGNTHYTEYILTSQTWRGVAWKHQLFLIIPSTLTRDATHALLVVAGGGWREEFERSPTRSPVPSSANVYTRIAELAATPVAVILQVPFQPLFGGLTEDRLIAHTFAQYLETEDREWPLLLPMVKSAVRAMDAVQAVMKQEWKMDMRSFTVTGASKRGWTTWLTGAIDERVTALAPMVIDVLNMAPQMEHAREIWGGPSPQVEAYTQLGILDRLKTPEGKRLLEMVDPYSYRRLLAKPKLIVNGTNDEYWPIDATRYYWDDLPGEKHIMVVPNTAHSLQDYSRVTAGVLALHQSQTQKLPMPVLTWAFEESAEALTIAVQSKPAPYQFRVWTTQRPDADFRASRWTSAVLPTGEGTAIHRLPRTAAHQAIFVEAEYRAGRPLPLNLTTLVRVVSPAEVPTTKAGIQP